jgi:hypothetical protein
MGRWSILVAQKFLDWLAISPAHSWLDVGCGKGSLTKLILENHQPKVKLFPSIHPVTLFLTPRERSGCHPYALSLD